MRTYCYSHGLVEGGCAVCPWQAFPQVTREQLKVLDAEQAQREGDELQRRLEQVLGPLPT